MDQDRERILKMVETGQISAEQALQLLEALDQADRSEEAVTQEPHTLPTDFPSSQGWWLLPVAVGAVVMAVGAPLMALGLTGRAAIFWAICCGWVPFLAGLGVLTVGVWSRSARWFHLRIKNAKSGRNTFALSLPLPLTLTAWVLRLVRPFVPQLKDTGVDEALLALQEGMSKEDDQPLFIDVQDDDDGEQILIFLG